MNTITSFLNYNIRWRSENVATTEVEAAISNVIGFKDIVVYGVEVNRNYINYRFS